MTHDVLALLARHDPANGLDATPPDALLAQLLAEPRTPSTPPDPAVPRGRCSPWRRPPR